MNDFNFCTMQIGLMYPNMSNLNKILMLKVLYQNGKILQILIGLKTIMSY